MKPNSLLFGTAGIPLSTPNRNILNGISHLTTLDLDGMEIEFEAWVEKDTGNRIC